MSEMGQTLSEPITSKETIVAKDEKYYVASTCMQGWRVSMEDAHTVLLEIPDDKQSAYFGVFDGHGGSAVSMFACRHLHKKIVEQHSYSEGDVKRAIVEGFLALDNEMRSDHRIVEEMSGSTATIILIKNGKIYCGNAGDSRAILCTKHGVIKLSNDHKPTMPGERSRIIHAGFSVQFNRVNGNLAVSRAFGDFLFKSNPSLSNRVQAVTCFPEVIDHSMDRDNQFIVIACDGIWDVMLSEEVAEFIHQRIRQGFRPEDIVEQLVTACLAPDGNMGGVGSDNMTVVLIIFVENVSPEYRNILRSEKKSPPKFLLFSDAKSGSSKEGPLTPEGHPSTSGASASPKPSKKPSPPRKVMSTPDSDDAGEDVVAGGDACTPKTTENEEICLEEKTADDVDLK